MELEVESCNVDTMYKANASAMSLLTLPCSSQTSKTITA